MSAFFKNEGFINQKYILKASDISVYFRVSMDFWDLKRFFSWRFLWNIVILSGMYWTEKMWVITPTSYFSKLKSADFTSLRFFCSWIYYVMCITCEVFKFLVLAFYTNSAVLCEQINAKLQKSSTTHVEYIHT